MKHPLTYLGIAFGLTSVLLLGYGFQNPQVSTTIPSSNGILAQANVVTYDDPVMAIATKYPGNMTVDANCSGEGCGYFFKFKPQNNALDQAEVHLFLGRGATTAGEVEKYVTGPNGLLASNGWIMTKDATPPRELMYPWVKQIITFSTAQKMRGYILIGETNGQGLRVTLLYPAEMSDSYWPAAKMILDNLEFKADKLPLKPYRE
jgi:hypothetical protein